MSKITDSKSQQINNAKSNIGSDSPTNPFTHSPTNSSTHKLIHSSTDTAIKVDHVSKKYSKSLKRSMLYGIKDIARNTFGLSSHSDKLRKNEFWALNNISFEVKKGETLGIIGPNGSGKTTLLKLLNGIFWPDKGKITVKGKVGALIEVGAGFHPLLTGRENIYINAAILGMTKEEVDEKFDDIIEFADIGDFLDAPVKHYSSGMFVRLGFAVAVHCEPNVLLVDEVLAVGDINFKAKCYTKIKELNEKGITILFISHSMELVSRICNHTIYLKDGKIQVVDETEKVVKLYERESQKGAGGDEDNVLKSKDIVIQDVRVYGGSDEEKSMFKLGDRLIVKIFFFAEKRIDNPNFYIGIYNAEGIYCMWLRNDYDNFFIPYIEGNGVLNIEFPEFNLSPGVYWINVQIFDKNFITPLVIQKRSCKFEITAKKRITGICYLKRRWNLQII